jgi:hypothetical protein
MPYRSLDDFFPVIVRYTGLALTVTLVFALIVAAFFRRGDVALVLAPGFVASSGMILYKTVRDAAKVEKNG